MDHSSSVSSHTASTTISAASSSAFSSSQQPTTSSSRSRKERQRRDKGKTPHKKISNTGALLDQYQDDDDLTTNLLHAIRSWNLERPDANGSASVTHTTSLSNSNRTLCTANTTNRTFDVTNCAMDDRNNTTVAAVGTPSHIYSENHAPVTATAAATPMSNNLHHDCGSTINTISDIDTATMASCSSTITSNPKGGRNNNYQNNVFSMEHFFHGKIGPWKNLSMEKFFHGIICAWKNFAKELQS